MCVDCRVVSNAPLLLFVVGLGCRTWLRSARLLPLPSRRGPSKLVSAFLLQGTTSVGFDSSIVDCLLLPGEMEPLDSAGT